MSISFSGLASGLDTSSWIESLVALKRAKVTVLQEQKEELVVSKDALSSIKNFFNSFRSTIEKITDTRFNIVQTNLFAQNIATSANLSVLTAKATADAKEGTYKVKVDKLASSTKATSGYKQKTTTTVTATATEDTLLTNIGVKTGTIGVTVGGIKYSVAITGKDTIGTFVDKLQKIGVEASFNEETGVFSMNLSANAIDDDMDKTNGTTSDTGIVEKLHLTGVNEGYKTENKLQVEKVETLWTGADATTKLVDLGVKVTGDNTITISADNALYDITIDSDTTIQDFVDALRDNQIDATYDSNTGIFTLNDAEILDVGDTDIINAFGLQETMFSKSQVSGNLSLSTFVTETTVADATTALNEISDWTTIVGDQTVVFKNSNDEYTTVTVNGDTTLGTLFSAMNAAGIYATINTDGTVEIAGGEITGGSFDLVDALGLSSQPYTAMVTGNKLTETTVEHKVVTLQTRLVEDLGVTKGYLEVTDADGNKFYEKIYSGQTIADFMADMGNLGIYTKLDENTGVLEITGGAFRTLDNLSDEVGSLIANNTIVENDDTYKQGTNLLECLYGSDVIATEQITVASTFSRTRSLTTTVTNFLNADLNTTLGNLGLTVEGTAIFNSHSGEITIDVTEDMTIQALREKLAENGISTEWDAVNSKLTVNNATLVGGTSDLNDVLNLTEVISGKYVNSDAVYTTAYQTILAEPSTLLTDLGLKIDNNMVYTSYTIDGTITESGVSGTVIGISSATDLQNLAKLVNEGNAMSGKTFVLTNDIDLSGIEWEAIGNDSNLFVGTFDGAGYTISNMTANKTITASMTENGIYVGLFGTTNNATIKNVTIKDAKLKVIDETSGAKWARIAGLVGYSRNGTTIQNVNVENILIETDAKAYCGGVVGFVNQGSVSIKNTFASGDIISSGSNVGYDAHVGGIVGYLIGSSAHTATISGAQSNIDININQTSNTSCAGGIIGCVRAQGTINVNDVLNKGSVTTNGAMAAGIIGGLEAKESNSFTLNLTRAINLGKIASNSYSSDILNFGRVIETSSSTRRIYITNCFGFDSAETSTSALYQINNSETNASEWSKSNVTIGTTGSARNMSMEAISNSASAAGYNTATWALTPTNINLKMASEEIILHKEDGSTYTLNVDDTTTLQDLVEQINYYGVTASISGGKFLIENGYIVNDALEEALGLETKISGESVVLGTQLTHTVTQGATGDSTLGEIIETLGATAESKVAGGYDLSFKGTALTVDENTTLNNLFEQISNAGGRAFLDSTGRVHIEGGVLAGSVAEALGFTTQTVTTAVSATGETITMMSTVVADATTKIEDLKHMTEAQAIAQGYTVVTDRTSLWNALNTSTADTKIMLGCDISLSGNEWDTISEFSGELNGNGYYISDLYSTQGGLFSTIDGATIKNIIFHDASVEVTGQNHAGVIAKDAINSTFYNCEVLNSYIVSEESFSGAFAGYASNCTMEYCGSDSNVIKSEGSSQDSQAGGVVGFLESSTIKSSYTIYNDIYADASVGGIAGFSIGNLVENCNIHSRQLLSSHNFVGILVAEGQDSTFKNIIYDDSDTGIVNLIGYASGSVINVTEGDVSYQDYSQCISIFNKNNELIDIVNLYDYEEENNEPNIGHLISCLSEYGISASINDGVISLVSTNGNYIAGPIAEQLGITSTSATSTIITGMTNTSSVAITYTQTAYADATTTLRELGIKSDLMTSVSKITKAEADDAGYRWVTTRAELTTALNAGENIVLGADIDLSDADWSSISTYSGTLDGNGYCISNMTTDNGFITNLSGGTIKNLCFNNANVTAGECGVIAKQTSGTSIIENCHVINSELLTNESDTRKGILVGCNNGNLTINGGTLYNNNINGYEVGGVVGRSTYSLSVNDVNVIDCVISGKDTAGILCYNSGLTVVIEGSKVSADIQVGFTRALFVGCSYINPQPGQFYQMAITNNQYENPDSLPLITSSDAEVTQNNNVKTDISDINNLMYVYDSSGKVVSSLVFNEDQTIEDFFLELNNYGINASINNGVISLVSANGNYIAGPIAEALGINVNETVSTVSAGKTFQSTVAVTYTETNVVDSTTKLNDIHMTEAQAIAQGYTVVTDRTSLWNALNTSTADTKIMLGCDISLSGNEWDTISEFSGELNGNGYTISNMSTSSGGFVGSLLEGSVIKNVAFDSCTVTSSVVTAGVIAMISQGGDIISCTVSNSNVYSTNGHAGAFLGAHNSGDANLSFCNSYNNTVRGGSNAGGYIGYVASSGSLEILDSVAFGNVVKSQSGNTGGVVGYNMNSKLVLENLKVELREFTGMRCGSFIGGLQASAKVSNSIFSDPLPVFGAGGSSLYTSNVTQAEFTHQEGFINGVNIYNSSNEKIAFLDFSETSTVGDIFTALAGYGISGSINNGVITLDSTNGNYIKGNVAERLGIGTQEVLVTTTVGTTATSTSSITYTKETVADYNSKISEYINRYEFDGKITESGVTGNVIAISTAEDLALLATHVNNGSNMAGKTFVLTNDIDLSGYDNWTPIGNDADVYMFSGTFDGNGHVISNLTQTQLATDHYDNGLGGLFGVARNATFKNIKLDNVTIVDTDDSNSYYHIGALVAFGEGVRIENVEVTNLDINVTTTDIYANIGGVAATLRRYSSNYSSIYNVNASGSINHTGEASSIGGVVGSLGDTNESLIYLYSNVNITAETVSYIGGIAGSLSSTAATIAQYCANEGHISSNNVVGGLFGKISTSESVAYLKNSYSYANLTGSATGEIVGHFSSSNRLQVEYCGGKTSSQFASSNGSYNSSNYVYGSRNNIIGIVSDNENWNSVTRIPEPADILIKSSSDSTVRRLINIEDMTFQELFDELSYYGINCTMFDGQIFVENNGSNYATGKVWEALGFEEVITTTTVTTTTPVQITSTAAVTYTTTTLAESTDTLGATKYLIDGSITASGVSGTVIGISTADELQYLANHVNNGSTMSGKTFVLTGDIDLGSISDWVGIGIHNQKGTSRYFSGTFDGQGYTIYNLTQNQAITADDTTQAHGGLFGYTSGATIKNLTLEDVTITSTNNDTSNQSGKIGGLAGVAINTKISGITVENISIQAGGNTYAGGIVGQGHNITITNSTTSSGNISSSSFTGGIIAYASCWSKYDIKIDNCQNNASITSQYSDAGGIVGNLTCSDLVEITNTLNHGAIKGYRYVGGIVGNLTNDGSTKITATIAYSLNCGLIESTDDSKEASIINMTGTPTITTSATISNCLGYSTATTAATELVRTSGNWAVSGVTTQNNCSNNLSKLEFRNKLEEGVLDNSKWTIFLTLDGPGIDLNIGDEYDIFVKDSLIYNIEKIDLNASSTLSDVSIQLSQYGDVTIKNGVVSFIPNSEYTVFGTGTEYLNTTLKVKNTETVTSGTTFRELGLTSDYTITIRNSSAGSTTYHYVTARADQTLGDLMTELASYGFDCSIYQGKLTVKPTSSDYHISSANTTLESKLKIDFAQNKSYTIATSTTTTYTSSTESDRLVDDIGYYIDSSTTFGTLGMPENSTLNTLTVYSGGEEHTITATSAKTVGEFMTELASYGITTEISEDGKFVFKADNDAYVKILGTDVTKSLKIYNVPNETVISTTYVNTTSASTLQAVETNTLDSSTTFSNLGITNSKEIEVVSNGNTYTVTVNPDQTVGDLMTTLAGHGIACSINNGKLVLQGDGENYVNSIDAELQNALQVEGINQESVTTVRTNTTSDELSYTSSASITSSTTVGSLHADIVWPTQTIELKSDGVNYTLTVSDSHTIGDILTSLAGYGIHGSINDGKLTLTGDEEAYITNITPELREALGLSDTYYSSTVITETTNTTSNKLSNTSEVSATRNSLLEDLCFDSGETIEDYNYELIISTESQEGSNLVTVTFTPTSTLQDVIDKLAEYGIDATIDSNGNFSAHSFTLTDFDLTGFGSLLLGDTPIKNYQTTSTSNTSTVLPMQTEELMNDSTQLGDLGISSGDVVVYKDGEKFTIAINEPQTVGDFRAQLGELGISSSIIEGKLQLIANGVVYLETPESNASNLVEIMGLGQAAWSKGDYSQKSDDLLVINSVTAAATLDTKIKDLTDENGNSLNISEGKINVYQNGVKNVIDIDTDDTIRELAEKLKNYGITLGVSNDGKLYFDGNDNSYLSTEGLDPGMTPSDILEKLNISEDWEIRYDSVSETLDYESGGEATADGSTRLIDLQDADGDSLGITTGTYYVYQNGVRNVETITADTTVNDFRATMASYGMTTDFDENGQLSVGAYNETYLATSALAGDNTNAIDVLFEQWNFVNIYTSNNLEIPEDVTVGISETTKLADINFADPDDVYIPGYVTVVKDGIKTNIEFTADDTVGDIMDELALYGFEAVVNSSGQLIIKNTGNSRLEAYTADPTKASNILELLGIDSDEWINTNTYEGSLPSSETVTMTGIVAATRDTLLSELGVKAGEYYIYNNGVRYTAFVSSDETIGSLMNTLESFGVQTSLVVSDDGISSILRLEGNGDSYVAKSNGANSSDVIDKLFNGGVYTNYNYVSEAKQVENGSVVSTVTVDETTLLSKFDNGTETAQGNLIINIDGAENIVQITADETFGSLIRKLEAIGLDAKLSDGHFTIESGYKEISISDSSSSKLLNNLGMEYDADLGGYSSSAIVVEDTQVKIEDKVLSAANYADDSTKMELLNISNGSLTIYRNGEKARIDIDNSKTFGELKDLIKTSFSDVELDFEDGYLKIYSSTPDVNVEVGATTDTSNFGAITGIANDGNGAAKSSRELFCVNGNSLITTAGLFRNGDVTEGTFIIGDEIFEITSSTRMSDLISQINASQDANATAYWDSIDGKLVIQSRTTGAALINIEAGTSNFTDIMGLTSTEWNCVSQEFVVSDSNELVSSLGITDGNFVISRKYKDSLDNEQYDNRTITINSNTKIKDLIESINETGLVEASWDQVNNRIVFNNISEGELNFMGGTSNALDILGLNVTNLGDADSDGNADIRKNSTKINIDSQEIGDNAKFSINGTYYTSTKNEIDSDVSRIEGLTINLKGISDTETTITVERDKETVANAVSDVVDAYNELIENIDKEIAKGQPLDDQSTLKLIRNQIRSLMVGSFAGVGTFKNLDAIGISLEKASASNISTTNINTLYFDKDKFIKAFDSDRDALKNLLVGTESVNGIFQQVEDVVERAVTTGYFMSAEKSYNNQISRLNTKIEKAEKAVERYREQLEAKFASMDLLISKMQNQYSSFLGI